MDLDSGFWLFPETANFTLHFAALFVLGLPMETVSGVQFVLRRACGRRVHGICGGGRVAEH